MLLLPPLREVLDQSAKSLRVFSCCSESRVARSAEKITLLSRSVVVIGVERSITCIAARCALTFLRGVLRCILGGGEARCPKSVGGVDPVSTRGAVGPSCEGYAPAPKTSSSRFALRHAGLVGCLGVVAASSTDRESRKPLLSAVTTLRPAMREFLGAPAFDAGSTGSLVGKWWGLSARAQAASLIQVATLLLAISSISPTGFTQLSAGYGGVGALGAVRHGQVVARSVLSSKIEGHNDTRWVVEE